jgi:hypothetical protein
MNDKEKRTDRPESYPRPSETDNQQQNQPEFIDQQPNEFHDKSISDIPRTESGREDNAHEKTEQEP